MAGETLTGPWLTERTTTINAQDSTGTTDQQSVLDESDATYRAGL